MESPSWDAFLPGAATESLMMVLWQFPMIIRCCRVDLFSGTACRKYLFPVYFSHRNIPASSKEPSGMLCCDSVMCHGKIFAGVFETGACGCGVVCESGSLPVLFLLGCVEIRLKLQKQKGRKVR